VSPVSQGWRHTILPAGAIRLLEHRADVARCLRLQLQGVGLGLLTGVITLEVRNGACISTEIVPFPPSGAVALSVPAGLAVLTIASTSGIDIVAQASLSPGTPVLVEQGWYLGLAGGISGVVPNPPFGVSSRINCITGTLTVPVLGAPGAVIVEWVPGGVITAGAGGAIVFGLSRLWV